MYSDLNCYSCSVVWNFATIWWLKLKQHLHMHTVKPEADPLQKPLYGLLFLDLTKPYNTSKNKVEKKTSILNSDLLYLT